MDLRTSLLLGELAFYSIWHNNPILHLYPMHPADSIGFILYSIPFFLLLSSKPAWRGGSQNFHFQGLPRTFSESSTRHHQQSSGHGAG